ncbi:UDP-N-acetylmuramoylalanyl-D-glutamate--2, 6-diaminopimelate ligase [Leptospira ryugenii]|uniref:UDP-N-acetylmuramoyl-L-alanyl-D-glutamate--2,6-diaminopimelate ligase n=1 Tax=Leptospira ryugenii TaxID=1917863 RepID=A0A2P2DWY5_9LEPT|nr:UDP-N-acetylmuramoyl-L-alanyl-D-glutamate--2,6-diaminopimelate ligase [Leptospira ryugenii]GBF49149.1 UDP-N-acetylmuramoylalanyl-D-glutamate--2, 6-diaminopimelate ligase [Leptospira ryugenii]
MKVIDIIKKLPEIRITKNETDSEIGYVHSDTRRVSAGDIFVFPEGQNARYPEFLGQLKEKNVKAILLGPGQLKLIDKTQFDLILETDAYLGDVYGKLAHLLAGQPSKRLKVVGITGTNGKTSLTYILYHIASELGKKCGLIGTVQIRFGSEIRESSYTTPDASSLNLLLKEMADQKIEYVFMEMSSHGLKLGRTSGIEVQAVGFTNLTQDHLDFHGTMEDYLMSKFKIFQLLESSSQINKFGILACDVPGGAEMMETIKQNQIKSPIFLLGSSGEYNFSHVKLSLFRSEFRLHKKEKNLPFIEVRKAHTNLLGNFNVFNVSMASFIALELGFPWEEILKIIQTLPTVPGRFQVVPDPKEERIAVVDYAHTPDALENVLKSCKDLNPRQLICLFGCGGDRDRTKRPQMGKIAEQYADYVVLTSDNPRTEDPLSILMEIESGFSRGFKRFETIADRRQAIQRSIQMLEKDGILLVCGKGHETYQIIGKEKLHFVDHEEVDLAFNERSG